MESRDEVPQMCWYCKERPATARYTDTRSKAPSSEMVCTTCFDRLEVQAAYGHLFIDVIIPLERNDQDDEALACLDAFLEANRHRDQDQWLARSVAMHRARTLVSAGRSAEAEQACKAWADVGFADVGQRWLHGGILADTLDALGRTNEGLAALEEALSHEDPREIPGAWAYLEDLAKFSKKLGQPVDPKWRPLAEATAAANDMQMPEDAPLGEAILEVAKAIRTAGSARRGESEDDDEDDEDEP